MRGLKPAEILKPVSRRFMMVPHLIISVSMVWGAFLDKNGSFNAQKFISIFEWAPIEIWGTLFGIAGLFALITLITAAWRTYVIANILTLGLSLMWLATIVSARFYLGFEVSIHIFGLWSFIVATCVLLAIIPTDVTRTR